MLGTGVSAICLGALGMLLVGGTGHTLHQSCELLPREFGQLQGTISTITRGWARPPLPYINTRSSPPSATARPPSCPWFLSSTPNLQAVLHPLCPTRPFPLRTASSICIVIYTKLNKHHFKPSPCLPRRPRPRLRAPLPPRQRPPPSTPPTRYEESMHWTCS